MRNRFDRKELLRIVAALGPDSKLHYVGGCVRDTLLGVEPKDFDLATVLIPDEVEKRLTAANIPFVVTGIRRGTITAVLDGEPIEITTFRNPDNEKEFVQDIETDLAARDFTINAIAVNAFTGELVDPFQGQGDLKVGIVRCVGSAEKRFTEDPHRILRLVRFAFGAGRWASDKTLEAAKKLAPLVTNIAAERVHDELINIVCSEHPADAIEALRELGVLKIVFPELEACFGVKQNGHHLFDVFKHILNAVENVRPDKALRFAALFHDIAKPRVKSFDVNGEAHFFDHERAGAELTREVLERLKFSNEDTEAIVLLVRKHGFDLNCGPAAVRRLLRDLGEEGLFKLLELKKADRFAGHVNPRPNELSEFAEKVRVELERERVKPCDVLAVDGNDVLALGVARGPEVGRLLNVCREAVLENPEVNEREFLLNLLNENK